MKKSKLKAILIALIIVICLNIGAYAAYVLSATDITYTKSDGTTVSVKEALDELHTTQPLAKAVRKRKIFCFFYFVRFNPSTKYDKIQK